MWEGLQSLGYLEGPKPDDANVPNRNNRPHKRTVGSHAKPQSREDLARLRDLEKVLGLIPGPVRCWADDGPNDVVKPKRRLNFAPWRLCMSLSD